MAEKKKSFKNKQTDYLGIWNSGNFYKSNSINLASLRDYKGTVKLIMYKNKYKQKDDNRPDFVFQLVDTNSEKARQFEVNDIEEFDDEEEKIYLSDAVDVVKDILSNIYAPNDATYDDLDYFYANARDILRKKVIQ